MGGAICSLFSSVQVQASRFAHNVVHGGGGGAININGGFLELERSHLFSNKASDNGGALYYNDGGDVKITIPRRVRISDSTFESNTAGNSGGAIFVGVGDIALVDPSASAGASVDATVGASVGAGGAGGALGSAFRNNSAYFDGGAIFLSGLLANMTIAANASFYRNTACRNGGAISRFVSMV